LRCGGFELVAGDELKGCCPTELREPVSGRKVRRVDLAPLNIKRSRHEKIRDFAVRPIVGYLALLTAVVLLIGWYQQGWLGGH
jgi:hypothetical protein